MVVELKDILRRLDRLDDHEGGRSKKKVAELRSIGDKLDQIVACLTNISTSLEIMSTMGLADSDDEILLYEGVNNDPVAKLMPDGSIKWLDKEEAEKVATDDLVNRFNDSFHEWGCYFPPKEEEAKSDCAGH